jgi:hypothetical protein
MGELYSNPRKNQALFAGSLFWGIGDDQGLSVCQLWERGTRRCSFANYVDQVRVGPGEEGSPASASHSSSWSLLQELPLFPRAHDCRPRSGFFRPRTLIRPFSLRTRAVSNSCQTLGRASQAPVPQPGLARSPLLSELADAPCTPSPRPRVARSRRAARTRPLGFARARIAASAASLYLRLKDNCAGTA